MTARFAILASRFITVVCFVVLCSNLVDQLRLVKGKKSKADQVIDLLNKRKELKDQFINKKQAVRSNLQLLKVKNENLAFHKETGLKELQEEFREIDSEFKEMGIMAERDELFDGARRGRSDDPSKMNNTDLLNKAGSIQKDNTEKLQEGLQVLNSTLETAKHTAATLEADKEKMIRISSGLDNVESELAISQKLLTNFVKRMYTDKVIVALTFLIVCGIIGIIVYASLNPDQKVSTVCVPVSLSGGACPLLSLFVPRPHRHPSFSFFPPFPQFPPQIFNVPDAIIPPGVVSPTPSVSPKPT